MTAAPAWTSAWRTALDDLELDIVAVEDLLATVHAAADSAADPVADPAARRWTELPPALGPMPADLADRARAVLRRQQQLAGDLTRAMVENRQQRRVAAAVHENQRPAAVPVYVDTAV